VYPEILDNCEPLVDRGGEFRVRARLQAEELHHHHRYQCVYVKAGMIRGRHAQGNHFKCLVSSRCGLPRLLVICGLPICSVVVLQLCFCDYMEEKTTWTYEAMNHCRLSWRIFPSHYESNLAFDIAWSSHVCRYRMLVEISDGFRNLHRILAFFFSIQGWLVGTNPLTASAPRFLALTSVSA
jgi:hypothetical protein